MLFILIDDSTAKNQILRYPYSLRDRTLTLLLLQPAGRPIQQQEVLWWWWLDKYIDCRLPFFFLFDSRQNSRTQTENGCENTFGTTGSKMSIYHDVQQHPPFRWCSGTQHPKPRLVQDMDIE